MLDLNIDAAFSVDSASYGDETDQMAVNAADADSVTSTTTCTTNNAVFAAPDELDYNSSTRRNSISTLNFAILNENEIEIDDEVNNGVTNNIIELQLFPVGAFSSSPAGDRAEYWLNSWTAPEVYCGGGVELGIFKAQLPSNNQAQHPPPKKSRRGPRSRSSQYRGVTFYRRTGRWESHIWDCGKQVYLGGFDTAHAAARAYDRAAVKFRGVDADLNFNISDYEEDMKQMKNLTKEEIVQVLRRQSNGLSRGSSKYRNVTLHGMGQNLQEKAYRDKATIVYKQRQPLTNIEPSNYNIREINGTPIYGSIGSGRRNLDLNLGITLASNGPQRNYTTSNYLHFPNSSSESPYGNGVKVQTSSASSQGLMTTTKYALTGGGMSSRFSPESKERAMAMSTEAVSLPGISNWEWKMESHGLVNSVPLSYSAASSGFSSAATPLSNPLMSSTSTPQFQANAFHGRR